MFIWKTIPVHQSQVILEEWIRLKLPGIFWVDSPNNKYYIHFIIKVIVSEIKKVKLSEGEALKNKDAKGSDKKVQIWIPKSTIAYEEEKLKLQIEK